MEHFIHVLFFGILIIAITLDLLDRTTDLLGKWYQKLTDKIGNKMEIYMLGLILVTFIYHFIALLT